MSRPQAAHGVRRLAPQHLEDQALLSRARGGDEAAYAALYDRHAYGAQRLARRLGMRDEVEDVVSESFAHVLDMVQRGMGTQTSFRAYLFTTIRHECGRRAKARARILPTDDETAIDTVVPFGGGTLDPLDSSAIRAAYESLPERWRTVLWHLDVEGRKPHELAGPLALSPNGVSALVYHARTALREAYLRQHVKPVSPDGSRACAEVRAGLPAVMQRTASVHMQELVHAHLSTCSACMAAHLELRDTSAEAGGTAGSR